MAPQTNCKAKGCPVNKSTHPGETLHSFPRTNQSRFLQWCRVAQRDFENVPPYSFLCHRHFEAADFMGPHRTRRRPGTDPIYRTGDLNAITGDYKPVESGYIASGETDPLSHIEVLSTVSEGMDSCCSPKGYLSSGSSSPFDGSDSVQPQSHNLQFERLEMSEPMTTSTGNKEPQRNCKAKGCRVSTTTHPGEPLHSFPRNDRRRFLQWCKVAERDFGDVPPYSFLCHRHFRATDYAGAHRTRRRPASDPIYRTGDLNAITGDYKPAENGSISSGDTDNSLSHVQVLTSSTVSSEGMDTCCSPKGNLASGSSSAFDGGDAVQPVSHHLKSEGLEMSQPMTHKVIGGSLADRAISPVARSTFNLVSLSQQDCSHLGVSPLISSCESTQCEVKCNGEGNPHASSTPLPKKLMLHQVQSAPTTSSRTKVSASTCSGRGNASKVAANKANSKFKVLGMLGLTRVSELTPQMQTLYRALLRHRKAACAMRKTVARKSLKLKACDSSVQSDVALAEKFAESMSLPAQLTVSQIRRFKRKPRRHRWTLGEKLLAVAMFKQSPRSYRFLRALFALPPPRTLTSLLNKVPLIAGINPHIFENLKQRIDASKDERFAYCALQWDEMSLKQGVEFSSSEDIIYGYEDLGHGKRSSKLAQHALVFSLVGLFHKWKQPIAFYFTAGSMESIALTEIIESVLHHCFLAGAKVKVTICDGHSINRKAYLKLGSKADKPFFESNGVKVYTMFDPPHLVKCIRNMLINHPLQFETDVTLNKQPLVGTAVWDDIVRAVEEDRKGIFRLMRKISPEHLEPTGSAKMRVELAAQVLSHSVASAIEAYVRYNAAGMDSRALHTAEVCSFFDQLFDSFNGYSPTVDEVGSLRTCLTKANQRMFYEFWNGAIKKLRSMVFLQMPKPGSTSTHRRASTPTLNGWIRTINAAKLLWESITDELPGIGYLAMRNLNLDPTEHLFGSIRSKCGGNFNPSALQFVDALKTCLLNGTVSGDIRGNCESEHRKSELLNNLSQFLSEVPPLIKQEIVIV